MTRHPILNILNRKLFWGVCGVLLLAGVVLRLWHIARPDFIFYDEGFYLNHNLKFGRILVGNYPHRIGDWFHALSAFIRISLGSGKCLWFLLADARYFFGVIEPWYIPRILAALCGIATLALTYCFAARFYGSRLVGLASAAMLAVLPSHVFYSRVGLQEALSTLLVLAGFSAYCSVRQFSWRTIAAGLWFAAGFFSNYRLIMVPLLVAGAEFIPVLAERRLPKIEELRKFVWFLVTFLCGVFIVGSLYNGANTFITFAWIFHQGDMAAGDFHPVNVFSYPYYLFRLEGGIFGLVFLTGLAVTFRKKSDGWLPAVIVLLQMGVFSLTSEKGARYLCAVMPFMAMTAASGLGAFIADHADNIKRRAVVAVLVVVLAGSLLARSSRVAQARSDYRPAAEFLLINDPQAKIVATQPYILNLYTARPEQVVSCPRSFAGLAQLYGQGYRYLILDPQAYISWAQHDERFNPELDDYLQFVVRGVRPVQVFDHFDPAALERFVFDHNTHLPRSVEFLSRAPKEGLGMIRIYKIEDIMTAVMAVIQHQPS